MLRLVDKLVEARGGYYLLSMLQLRRTYVAGERVTFDILLETSDWI